MLKLSQKWDDALNAICYIAEHHPKIVQIRDIAQHHKLHEWCLRLIIHDLAKGGIVITKQGRNWGIFLAKKIHTISLYDVFFAIHEELAIVDCTRGLNCEKQQYCYNSRVLWNLEKVVHSLLKMQTLDKIIKNDSKDVQ